MLAENPPIPYRICLAIYRVNNKFLNGLIYTVAACAWLITIHKLQIGATRSCPFTLNTVAP